MQKVGKYWLPNVDMRGAKRSRNSRADFEESSDGKQIVHLFNVSVFGTDELN